MILRTTTTTSAAACGRRRRRVVARVATVLAPDDADRTAHDLGANLDRRLGGRLRLARLRLVGRRTERERAERSQAGQEGKRNQRSCRAGHASTPLRASSRPSCSPRPRRPWPLARVLSGADRVEAAGPATDLLCRFRFFPLAWVETAALRPPCAEAIMAGGCDCAPLPSAYASPAKPARAATVPATAIRRRMDFTAWPPSGQLIERRQRACRRPKGSPAEGQGTVISRPRRRRHRQSSPVGLWGPSVGAS